MRANVLESPLRPPVSCPVRDSATDPGTKEKKATKMGGIFVLIIRVPELLKIHKMQLVLGRSNNI
jgi:hypothetical protein